MNAPSEKAAPPLEEDHSLQALERKKLLREIADLDRSWWRKPAFVGVLGPTLLAAGSLGYGIFTGAEFLDLERSRLENDKTLLAIQNIKATNELTEETRKLEEAKIELGAAQSDVAALETKVKTRAAQIETELRTKEAELEAELKRQEAAYAQELQNAKDVLDAELTRERDAFLAEKTRLNTALDALRTQQEERRSAFDAEIAAKEQRLEELQKQLRAPEVFTLLTSLRESRRSHWSLPSMARLIALASASAETRQIIEQEAQNASSALYRASLLYLLQKADPSPVRFQAILDQVDANLKNGDVWRLFAWGRWTAEEEALVLARIIEAANLKELTGTTLAEALNLLYLPKLSLSDIKKEVAGPEGHALVKQSWDLSLFPVRSYHVFVDTIRLSSILHPAIGLAHASLLADKNKFEDVEFIRVRLKDHINKIAYRSPEWAGRYSDASNSVLTDTLPDWASAELIAALKADIEAGNVAGALARLPD